MELYWASGSPYAWRAMLGLLFKGIRYEDHQLSFKDRDHKTPHYTLLNPRCKVPTLVDGEVVVTESVAILAYLDRVHPRKMLFGSSAADAGRIWRTVMEIDHYLDPIAMDVIRSLYFQRWQERVAELREKRDTLFEELDLLEDRFEGGAPNAIDCLMVPLLASMERASLKQGADKLGMLPLNLGRWPQLRARYLEIAELPGFDRTYPPHWR